MPKYQVTAPNGGTYEVNAPDGATQDQVMAYAQANYGEAGQVGSSKGPWTKYQQAAPAEQGPWTKYQDKLPPLPPGFVLEDQQQAGSMPPLPPGFVLETAITDLPGVTSRPDFSGVSATVNGERVGKSGVRESERQAQIAAMDQAVDYEGQLDSLNTQEGIGRALGVGGRAMWRGLAAIPDIVVAPLTYGINKLGEKGPTTAGLITGERERHFPKQKTITETADYVMDRMGAPRPETPQERISNDLTSGLTGTLVTFGAGSLLQANRLPGAAPTVAQGVGNLLTSQPRTQIAATAAGAGASSIAREGGATPGQQAALGLTAGLLPGTVSSGGAAATRGLMRGTSGATLEQNINAFSGAGTTPTAGQAAANRRLQGLETFLSTVPGGAGPMATKATTQAQQVGARLDDLAGNLSPRGGGASAETAGRAVSRGVDTYAKNIKARRDALYWQVDQQIPNSTQLPMANTQRALTRLTALTPGAESTTAAMINPKIAQLAANVTEDLMAARAAGSTGLPYSAVKDIRSRIGQELSDFSLSTDKPTAQYKRLYAALSQDMEEAARQQGPDAVRAVTRANNYYKLTAARLEQLERVVDKSGGPEKVYQAALSGTGDGATTLRALVRSIPPESKRELTAAFIRRMGRATPGQQNDVGNAFSMGTFLTNWNKVSPEARRVLFDTHGARFSASMDQIAKAASNIRDGSKVFANPSGTAARSALVGGVTGTSATVFGLLAAGQIGTAALVAGGAAGAAGAFNGLSRAMANPNFVNWLAMSTKMPISSLPSQVVMLRRIAAHTDDESVAEVADELERRAGQSPQ